MKATRHFEEARSPCVAWLEWRTLSAKVMRKNCEKFQVYQEIHYLIHELYLTNLLSFLELLNCGTHCHPLLSLNPTICHLLNLTSINLILSPFLLKLPIFSVFSLSGLCHRPYGLSPTFLAKKNLEMKREWHKKVV